MQNDHFLSPNDDRYVEIFKSKLRWRTPQQASGVFDWNK
jgi:hypothetical protein